MSSNNRETGIVTTYTITRVVVICATTLETGFLTVRLSTAANMGGWIKDCSAAIIP